MALLDAIGFGSTGWGGVFALAMFATLGVTATALAIGAATGALVAAAKLQESIVLTALANAYTTLLRSVPELLIVYLIYFGGSSAITSIAQAMGYDGFIGLSSFAAGALAVGLISGAYQAEVFRSAFLAIPKGEIEAARAIGMSRILRFRRIVIAQVFRFAIPGIGNVWQLSLKDSALVSVTGLVELMRASQIAAGSTRKYFLFFIVGGSLYLLLSAVSNRIFTVAEKRANRSMQQAFARYD